eukprot:TRINITY_DN1701_c10_g1_i1.p1 TRINITY_DN1701_c10_g1~~TRINITY_DN1701_c10_g1_i1.p1  ORF type:complete len:505 (+),score=193.60 TRINITY_DN1701_c10_g1_i1:205-1515(+)
MDRARTIERMRGHVHAAPPAPSARVAGGGPLVFPTEFGADPTGKTDSTKAMQAAMAAMLNKTRIASASMADAIADMGGVTMDLAGGDYLISQPIVVPPFFGNLHFRAGTLRASPSFPADKWLLMVGDMSCKPLLPSGKPDGQGACNEFVSMVDMLFDAAHVAAGGVYIAKVMGTTVGPSAFFTGFKDVGIKIDAGHEVMVSEAWLAECYWSDKTKCGSSSSVGIQVNGNDHYLSNVVVFDYVKTGVEINGAANILTGVHTWNGGGVGIALGSPTSAYGAHQNRVLGCYLDGNTLDMYDPTQVVVESTFFLGTHAVIHSLNGKIEGLAMRYNTYTTPQSVVLDGSFAAPRGVVLSDEIDAVTRTRATRSLSQTNATKWAFDFSDVLLFPSIDTVQYSVSSAGGFFMHHALPAQGRKVTVVTSQPTTATVVVTVWQAQ